jgi:hypothetical protein
MMKFLVPLVLAAVALTIQAKPLGDTNSPPSYQPENTPGKFHHMATIGGYEFRIFLDDSAQPPKAYAVQTDESIEKMDKTKNPLKEIKRSSREVRIYLRSFLGLPPQVEPDDLPEDRPKNNFGQDPEEITSPAARPGMPVDNRPPAQMGRRCPVGREIRTVSAG